MLETLVPGNQKYQDVIKVYEAGKQGLRIMADIVSQKLICFINRVRGHQLGVRSNKLAQQREKVLTVSTAKTLPTAEAVETVRIE